MDLLPPPLCRRLTSSCQAEAEADLRPTRIAIVIACLAFGAFTHVFWDSFTHSDGWGVHAFPFLQSVVTDYPGRPIRLYALLQHGSSLVLLPPMTLGFIWWSWKLPDVKSSSRESFVMPRWIPWTAIAMMAVGSWIYFQSLHANQLEATWVGALRTSVKHCGAVAIVVVMLYCLGMHLTWWFQARQTERNPIDHELQVAADGRLCLVQTAHEVRRSRPPHTGPQPRVMADGDR